MQRIWKVLDLQSSHLQQGEEKKYRRFGQGLQLDRFQFCRKARNHLRRGCIRGLRIFLATNKSHELASYPHQISGKRFRLNRGSEHLQEIP